MYQQDVRNYVVRFSSSIDIITRNLDSLVLLDEETMESSAIALEENLTIFETSCLHSPTPRYNILHKKYYFADRLYYLNEFTTMNSRLFAMCQKIKKGEELSSGDIQRLNIYYDAIKELNLNLNGGLVSMEETYKKEQFNEFLDIFEADLKLY